MDDEHIYEQVAAELKGGNRDEGLWTKCFAECDGDKNKAEAQYLKTRVERLTGKKKGQPKNQVAEEDLYYVNDEDKEFGPYTKDQLQSKLNEFSIEALYELEGTGDWYNLHDHWGRKGENWGRKGENWGSKKKRQKKKQSKKSHSEYGYGVFFLIMIVWGYFHFYPQLHCKICGEPNALVQCGHCGYKNKIGWCKDCADNKIRENTIKCQKCDVVSSFKN